MHNDITEFVPEAETSTRCMELAKQFSETVDTLTKAEIALQAREEFVWSYLQVDTHVVKHQGWCGNYIWMAFLSDRVKALVRNEGMAFSVAKYLYVLPKELQDKVLELISSQNRNPLAREGMYAFIRSCVTDYDKFVDEAKKTARSTGLARFILNKKTTSTNPKKVAVENCVQAAPVLTEALKLLNALTPEELAEVAGTSVVSLLNAMRALNEQVVEAADRLQPIWRADVTRRLEQINQRGN